MIAAEFGREEGTLLSITFIGYISLGIRIPVITITSTQLVIFNLESGRVVLFEEASEASELLK